MKQRLLLKNTTRMQVLATQREFIDSMQEIDNFLKLTSENFLSKKAREALNDMRGKFSDMLDIYHISPENFPGLPAILSKNSEVLKKNFNIVKAYIETHKIEPENWCEFIYNSYYAITEQYIKIVIEGLYGCLKSHALPSLPYIQTKEALSFSMINLEDFFRQNIKIPYALVRVLNELKTTEVMLFSQMDKDQASITLEEQNPDPESTYIILLSALFSQLKNISLDGEAQEIVAKTMVALLSVLQKNFTPLALVQINSCVMSNLPTNLLPVYLNFTGLFNICSEIQSIAQETKDVKNVLSKMYEVYSKNHDDFLALPEILLKDARNFKNRCQNFILDGKCDELSKELSIFHQEMLRRCFQMQIYSAYDGNTNTVNEPEYTEKLWSETLTLISQTILSICRKIANLPEKSDFSVIEKISLLEQLLLLQQESPLFSISVAKQRVAALANVFKSYPKIIELPPKLLEKVIETLEEHIQFLSENIESDLLGGDKPVRKKILSSHPPQPAQVPSIFADQCPLVTITFKSFGFFSPKGSSDAALRKNAGLYGLICKNVAGDGNCLFAAMALHLKSNFPETYQNDSLNSIATNLRQQTIHHIRQYRNKYQAFVEDNRSFDEYLEAIGKPGAWGSDMELRALAAVLNASIVVIRSDKENLTIYRNQNEKTVICLGYQAPVHYQLLIPKYGKISPLMISIINQTPFMDNYAENQVNGEIISPSPLIN